jgi:hypothetical protein
MNPSILPPERYTIAQVIEHASKIFGVPTADILGRSKGIRETAPRHAVCLVAKEELGKSNGQIGKAIGRTPCTVRDAIKAARRRFITDDSFQFRLRLLRLEVGKVDVNSHPQFFRHGALGEDPKPVKRIPRPSSRAGVTLSQAPWEGAA